MNIIDIICLVFLVYALYRGFKNGLLLELGSIVSLLVGVWLASRFGEKLGLWLGFDNTTAKVGGFVLLLIAVVLLMFMACRLVRLVIDFTGLGLFDRIGGCIVSVIKTALVLSLILNLFIPLNAKNQWIKPSSFDNSQCCEYLEPFAASIFPYIEQAKDMYMEHLES